MIKLALYGGFNLQVGFRRNHGQSKCATHITGIYQINLNYTKQIEANPDYYNACIESPDKFKE